MHRFFLFFSLIERLRKGSDLPKKKWVSPSIQQKYSQIKLPQRSSALYFVEFRLGARALEIHEVALATSCTACAQEMRSSNGRERP